MLIKEKTKTKNPSKIEVVGGSLNMVGLKNFKRF